MRAALRSLTVFAFVLPLSAQQPNTALTTVSQLLAGMKSPGIAKREKAFDEADQLLRENNLAPADVDRLKVGIIQLLSLENERRNPPDNQVVKQPVISATKTQGTEKATNEGDESEYYPALIGTVAGFKDERAIPALLGAIPSDSEARQSILEFGDKALRAILEQLKSRNALLRATMLDVGITLLKRRGDTESRVRISEVIQTSLNDPNALVRTRAVQLIDCLENRKDFQLTLEKIAETDPATFPTVNNGSDGNKSYPVRFNAKRVLNDIRDGGRFCRDE